MRREGFELLVGPPTVITKQVDGKTHEPFETVEVQVRPEFEMCTRTEGQVLLSGCVFSIFCPLASIIPSLVVRCCLNGFVLTPSVRVRADVSPWSCPG